MKRLNDTTRNTRRIHLLSDPTMKQDIDTIRRMVQDWLQLELSQRTITKRAYQVYRDHLNGMVMGLIGAKGEEWIERRKALHQEMNLLYRTAGKDCGPALTTALDILESALNRFTSPDDGLSKPLRIPSDDEAPAPELSAPLHIPSDGSPPEPELSNPKRVMPRLRIPEKAPEAEGAVEALHAE